MRPADTSEEAWTFYLQTIRAMRPEDRVSMSLAMTEDADRMVADGVRLRHPEYSPEDVEWAMKRRRVDDDALFREVWPGAPLLPL